MLKLLMSPAGLALDRWLVRWAGHSLLNRVFARKAGFAPRPALLLETRGRRSGQPRRAALPYFVIDGKLIVVGSRGGMPSDPAWVVNLREHPEVVLYIHRRRHRARARIASGGERAELWARLTAIVPTYAHYQSLTEREIPVVIFEGESLESL